MFFEGKDDHEPVSEGLIHFIRISARHRDLSLIAYIALKSALLCNPRGTIILHSNHPPCGPVWDLAQSFVRLDRVDPPVSIHNVHIRRIEHKVDVLRLEILNRDGGIYLDLDTICIRGLRQFRRSVAVMGRQANGGLCNAFIAAPAGAEFINRWLNAYRGFHNGQWDLFSVKVPLKLAQDYPHLIDVEPASTFFVPGAHQVPDLFKRNNVYPDACIFHLWASVSREKISRLDVNAIFNVDTTYNVAARHVIGDDRPILNNIATPAFP